jgi:23S rRNA (uracil1939-C5)-methyltransferase
MRNKSRRSGGRSRKGGNKKKRPLPAVEMELRIDTLGRHCDGVGHVEDGDPRRHYVPFALPGEAVRARVAGKSVDLIEVIEPSSERILPFCQYFGQCGGCVAQHLNEAAYNTWKRGVIETAFSHREFDIPVDDVVDAHGEGRRRVSLHVEVLNGKTRAGFMKASSRDLIELESCPILAPALATAPNIAIALAAPFANQTRQLDIALTATPQGLDCDIKGGGDTTYDIHVSLAELADRFDLARISLDGENALERRKPMMPFGDFKVPIPPASFLQATEAGEETLSAMIMAETGGAKRVADLFCGAGPFALRIASQASVYAADSNSAAVAALRDGARYGEGLKPVEVEVRDLFRNPVFHEDLNQFDAVVLNPARAGAEAQVEEIAQSTVPLVVYVSCDPASLARDAEHLMDGGYDVQRIVPVDQFKYSAHIEAVAVFRRK